MNRELAHSISKRGRVGEGRSTKRTPEVVAKIAEAVASGLTGREAGVLAGIRYDTMTEWRKDPEFSEAIEKATAQRLLQRLGRYRSSGAGLARHSYEDSGQIIGWTSLSAFYGRPAYKTVEVSTYVTTQRQRSGFGTALRERVLSVCPRYGIKTILSFVFEHNLASIHLNEKQDQH